MKKSVKRFIDFFVAAIIVSATVLTLGSCSHEHVYGEGVVTKEPTCAEEGSVSYKCEICDKIYTEAVPALGHDYDSVLTEPTCTEKGFITHTCLRCGDSYVSDETEPLGHDYISEILKIAVRSEDGITKYTCLRCGDEYTETFAAQALPSEQIYDMASKSVGEIITYDADGKGLSLGTCFVIGEDGTFLTNFHVIDEARYIEITVNGATYDVTEVLAYDEDIDLAVLKVDGGGFSPLILDKGAPAGGATVYAAGSSEGFTLSFTTGVVSSPDRVIDDVHFIQHDAAISSGNSGGPLFDTYGSVIGVNTMTYTEGQNINFAIAISETDKLDYSAPLTMERFYEEYGPYFTVWIGDYIVPEAESNNSMSAAQTIYKNGTTISGSVNGAYDIDYYRVTIGAGETLNAILYPEYKIDATGMLCGLLDRNEEVLEVGRQTEISDTDLVYLEYKNKTSAAVTVYVVILYNTSYQYRNTVGNYYLFIYSK